MSPLELVRGRLEHLNCNPCGRGQIRARCPAHRDHNPSLSVGTSDKDGSVLVRCHAGCSTQSVLKALGLRFRDLYVTQETFGVLQETFDPIDLPLPRSLV